MTGGAGGKTSPNSTSLRILKTFSLGAPTSGWDSWIFGNSSEIATRTGSSGRLFQVVWLAGCWIGEVDKLKRRDVPLLPT